MRVVHAISQADQHPQSAAPAQAEVDIARSSRRRGLKMPGVSTKIIMRLPGSMAMPRTSARVVCTLRERREPLEPTKLVQDVDLPGITRADQGRRKQRGWGCKDTRLFLSQTERKPELLRASCSAARLLVPVPRTGVTPSADYLDGEAGGVFRPAALTTSGITRRFAARP